MPKNELKTEDDFEVGLLRIDWERRQWEVTGIGGHSNDVMTPDEVLHSLDLPRESNIELVAVVAWKENADGEQQLCFYDRSTFQEEVYGPVGAAAGEF